jgi:hypothetical protein
MAMSAVVVSLAIVGMSTRVRAQQQPAPQQPLLTLEHQSLRETCFTAPGEGEECTDADDLDDDKSGQEISLNFAAWF